MFSFHENSLAGGYPPDPHPTVARRDHGARSAGQDHRMAHAGHTATANRSAEPSAPPPRFRGSIIRREDVEFPGRETRNRGYSYPSWGRVRALQAIPRPRIPPDRPQNARMAVSAVFRASGGTGLGCLPPVGQRPIHGRILKPAPVRAKLPAGRRGSRRPGRWPGGGYARPSPPRRVSRGGAPPRPPLPWRAGNAGVRGGRAPRQRPRLYRGYAGLCPPIMQIPA